MIIFNFNATGTDYYSVAIAVISLFVAVYTLRLSSRQFRISAEMNFATMSVRMVDDINKCTLEIENATIDNYHWSIIDLANALDIACAFRLSHETEGLMSMYFTETLESTLRILNNNTAWLAIIRDNIQEEHEYTNIKCYCEERNEFRDLTAMLIKQRRPFQPKRPWLIC